MTIKEKLEEIIASQKRKIASLRAENKLLKKKTILSANNDKEFFALRELIALMPGNIFWKDKEGKLLGCNNQLAKILSLTCPDEIIGKHTIDLVGEELAEQIDKIDKEIMASTTPTRLEELGFNENREPATYLSYKIPLKSRTGEVIGLLGTSLDITEHKKMETELKVAKEKAEASNRAKSRFLAVINHELRTPLTGILGLVDYLKRDNLSSAEKEETIEDLKHCAQNLLTLVNDVLNFSRLDAGKYFPNPTIPIHFQDIIDEVVSITIGLAKNKGLELQTSIDSKIKKPILTDPHLLRQILINIVTNGIKFTEKGQIIIEALSLKQSSESIKLEIAISDTGPGIPADKLGVIFEPFQQLEDAYTRSSSRSGTGLGLAIVKRMSSLLNIDIHVVSELGKGSTFYLIGEFKVSGQQSDPIESNPLSNRIVSNKESKRKILLVEDDKIVQRIHKSMFVEMGYEVDISGEGHEALKMLHDHDIIFVDLGLPDITGFEVIQTIRKRHTGKQNIPIIALTGFTGEEEKSACLAAGANEIASKPIAITHLKDILDRYMKV